MNDQYLRDVPAEKRHEISPDAWTHDLHFLQTKEDRNIQVQLFQDYQTNIDQYPKWQALFREKQYPALIIWGKNDAAFSTDGARAFLRDLPEAKLVLLDAGALRGGRKRAGGRKSICWNSCYPILFRMQPQ